MASQLCSEVNGGSCKNKVSARNGFVCAAGHGKSSGNDVARPAISISKMSQNDRKDLARSTEDETLQLQLLHTGDLWSQKWLAQNPSIGEDLQLELFRSGNANVQKWLAQNPSIGEDLQWGLFRIGNADVQWGLAYNSSIGEDIAIELAKVGQALYGYTRNKPLAELIQPENLALLGQYPERFGAAYLDRLLNNPQEDKEESKALTLHSYLVYEKSGGEHTRHYKGKILERYAGDQEVALIISTEPAQ